MAKRKQKPGRKPVAERDESKRTAWMMSRQMHTQEEIAAHLGVAVSTVQRWLAQVEQELWQEFVPIAERLKIDQTLKIERLFKETWGEWLRSKEDAEKRTLTTGGEYDLETHVTEGQTGNARYIEAMRKLLEDIRKIWGAENAINPELMQQRPVMPINLLVAKLTALAGGNSEPKPPGEPKKCPPPNSPPPMTK